MTTYRQAKINSSLDREDNFRTPTEADVQCPFFQDHFIGWGRMKERRAICDDTSGEVCGYKYKAKDGTPLCLRYWYGPAYEILDEKEEPMVQKVDQYRRPLYLDEEGNETLDTTGDPIMLPITEVNPIPYVENTKIQEKDENDKPLYWNHLVDPPEKVTEAGIRKEDGSIEILQPVMIETVPHFFSTQHIDTHGKIFKQNGNELGWFHRV